MKKIELEITDLNGLPLFTPKSSSYHGGTTYILLEHPSGWEETDIFGRRRVVYDKILRLEPKQPFRAIFEGCTHNIEHELIIPLRLDAEARGIIALEEGLPEYKEYKKKLDLWITGSDDQLTEVKKDDERRREHNRNKRPFWI